MIDKALVARAEGSLAKGMAASARAIAERHPELGSTVVNIGTGQAVLFGPGMWVNRVVGLGLDAPVGDADFDLIDGVFQEAGLRVELDISPWADETLLAGAAARGMGPVWFRSLLVRSVSAGDRDAPEAAARVDTARSVAEWQDISAAGFAYHDEPQRWANDVNAEAAHRIGDTLLVATVDGTPVGAAALATSLGVAVLYGTSTTPYARRRGVQAALIGARIARAATAGCDLVISTAVPGGASERNLLRHGFRLVCTKVGVRRTT